MTVLDVAYVFDARFVYQLCISFLTYIAIRLILYVRVRRKRYKLFEFYGIPGPSPRILDGNFKLYRQNAANFLADDYCRAKYGKTYGIFLGDEPQIMSVDLEFLRAVFLDNKQLFKDRMFITIESKLSESVIFAPYHRWVFIRRLMSPLFNKYKMRGNKSVEFVEFSIKLLLEHIENKFETQDKSERVRLVVMDLMRATTLHSISYMAIDLPNIKVEPNEEHVRALHVFLGIVSDKAFNMIIKYPFLKSLIEFVSEHFPVSSALNMLMSNLNATIDKKLKQLKSGESEQLEEKEERLLDLLISSHYKGQITRRELIANCLAILIAGYDTTSTTLTYLLWVLARHQSVQEMLRSELMTYGTEAPYLDQVINETMRLYPAVTTITARLSAQTVVIGDIVVPKGTRVNHNTWIVHRDPEIWPEPLKFDPGRFAPGVEHHPCAFAPFGLGARKCLGYQLAILEIKMVVCDILLRYRITLASPDEMECISYSNVMSRPKEEVLIELERL